VSFFISGGMFLVVGLYLLRGAPALMRYAYPTSNKTNNDWQGNQAMQADGAAAPRPDRRRPARSM